MTDSRNIGPRNTDELLDKVKTTLDRAAMEIDGATQTRLRAIRREALAVKAAPYGSAWWVTAGGLASVATVTVLTASLWLASPQEGVSMPPLEDIALLSGKEELEFYEELDFYLWLEHERLNSEQPDNEQNTG